MEQYCRNLEDQNPERNVDNGEVSHEVSEGKGGFTENQVKAI